MFLSVIGLFLLVKRYPNCSVSKVIRCLMGNSGPPANRPRVNIQVMAHLQAGLSGQQHKQHIRQANNNTVY